MNYLVYVPRINWRTNVNYKVNTTITVRNRVEWVQFDRNGSMRENGFLLYFDLLYKPLMKPLSAMGRIQYFDTDRYNARVYAYENDVMYGYSIPGFFGKGHRYYVTLNYDVSKRLSCWIRIAQTVYDGQETIGSGLDEIRGNRKTEVKFQLRYMY